MKRAQSLSTTGCQMIKRVEPCASTSLLCRVSGKKRGALASLPSQFFSGLGSRPSRKLVRKQTSTPPANHILIRNTLVVPPRPPSSLIDTPAAPPASLPHSWPPQPPSTSPHARLSPRHGLHRPAAPAGARLPGQAPLLGRALLRGQGGDPEQRRAHGDLHAGPGLLPLQAVPALPDAAEEHGLYREGPALPLPGGQVGASAQGAGCWCLAPRARTLA